jgi:hypothetical protein
MELLLEESLGGSLFTGLVDTEQPQLVREVFDLIEHHDRLPMKKEFWGVGKLRVEARPWLINEIRRAFFPQLSLWEGKRRILIKAPPPCQSQPQADADERCRPDSGER